MSRTVRGGAAAAMIGLLAACGGSPPESPSQPAATSATSATVLPSATPTPRRTPTPVVSPTVSQAPDRRQDRSRLQQALVTAEDLGRPWVVVEGGPPAGAVEPGCPGKPSAVRRLAAVADVRRDMTRGRGELVNGASFGLATLRDTDGSAVRAAWRADTRACREHTDASDFFVVYRLEGPSSARNADEILFSRAERIYFDRGDTEPAYARHTLVARTGRVVTTVSYTFLVTDSGGDTANFTQARKLLELQLAKVATGFEE
jgi:hypothetical protein